MFYKPDVITQNTYMELNMPIKAVKQKPMANMDFMRTYKQTHTRLKMETFLLVPHTTFILNYRREI